MTSAPIEACQHTAGSLDHAIMKALVIATSCLGMATLSASEIRWTARGTTSSAATGAFSSTGVAINDPVEITMSYSSALQTSGRSLLFYPENVVAGRAWFYGAANLVITVKIGENTWTGEMPNIELSNVMESVCYDNGGPSDWFNVTLDSARGGTFPSFPQTGTDTDRTLKLEFRDDISPPELFDVHVLPDSVTNLCAMSSATGTIQVGASSLLFTIDPASVRIARPQVQASISPISNGIRLNWETQADKSYRIEGSSNFRCWSDEGVFSGTGAPRQQDFTPFELHPKRFYRISEL